MLKSLCEQKIIAHINSYYDSVFTSPNYELIQKLGDFNFGMDDVPPLQSPRRTFGSSTLECSPMMVCVEALGPVMD